MSRRLFTFFEHSQQPLLPRKAFAKRVFRCAIFAFSILVFSIFLGAAMYHYGEGQDWLEATLNAVMVMTGLGLVDTLHTPQAKLFTCVYALLAAVVFYMVLAIIFAPLIHRFLHEFHLEIGKGDEDN